MPRKINGRDGDDGQPIATARRRRKVAVAREEATPTHIQVVVHEPPDSANDPLSRLISEYRIPALIMERVLYNFSAAELIAASKESSVYWQALHDYPPLIDPDWRAQSRYTLWATAFDQAISIGDNQALTSVYLRDPGLYRLQYYKDQNEFDRLVTHCRNNATIMIGRYQRRIPAGASSGM